MTCLDMERMVSSVAMLVALYLHLGLGDITPTVQHLTDTIRIIYNTLIREDVILRDIL